jgi:diaminopimelate epimerase
MIIPFTKYHAVGNDFIVVDKRDKAIPQRRLTQLALAVCNRRTGVGADGILVLSRSRKADCRLDVYNSDGGWAEKSGNGLRTTAVHLAGLLKGRRSFAIETGTSVDHARVQKKVPGGYLVRTELGAPDFLAKHVPMRTRNKYVIASPVRVAGVALPMTCLSVGNPHCVVLVDDFDWDWQALGVEIEHARPFPKGTNVEFVKVLSRHKLRVAEWERGAGATGSSGTGAAAAVSAMVMLGLVERTCEVEFDFGSLTINWRSDTDVIELTGPVHYIMDGTYVLR